MPRKVKRNGGPDVTAPAVAVGSVQVETTIAVRARSNESNRRSKATSKPPSRPQIPRITRLMALAIKFQEMVDRGEVRDYADIARLGYVTRARVTQIMNLLNLAPDIQQALLDGSVDSEFTEREARDMTRLICWDEQRRLFGAAALAPARRATGVRVGVY